MTYTEVLSLCLELTNIESSKLKVREVLVDIARDEDGTEDQFNTGSLEHYKY